jgi:hypothetical protein
LAVTEAAANCIAEQIAASPLGRFEMNHKNLNDLLHHTEVEDMWNFNTTSISDKFSIFEDKIGPNVPI